MTVYRKSTWDKIFDIFEFLKKKIILSVNGLIVELNKTFTDKCSKKDTNRHQLKLLIEYALKGDIIHIHEISRTARNTEGLLRLIK